MFFAIFITLWIDKRNKFHFSADSDVKKDGRPGQKKSYFNTQMDGHYCNLLPHPIWEGQGDRPASQSHPYCCLYLIQYFTHLLSKDIILKFKILLPISPFRYWHRFFWNASFRKDDHRFLSGFFLDHHLCISQS